MLFIRSLLFYLGAFCTLVPHSFLCVLIGAFLPLKTRYRYFVLWNVFSVWWLRITCGVRFQVHGANNVPPAPFVLLSNHQSPWETLYLYYAFAPLCAILKRELLVVPFFGWGLRLLAPIAIDRNRKTRALQQLLEQGKARLDDGISVLVFPEGTRVHPGAEKKYSPGGAELAITAGKMIVPLAHDAGSRWPARTFVKRPGVITVVIGKPIAPQGRRTRELTAEVERWTREVLAACRT